MSGQHQKRSVTRHSDTVILMQDPVMPILETITTQAVVVGGGIAGSWCALKLAKRNIPTVLLTYQQTDRGGLQGSTRRSVGAINFTPINEPNLDNFLDQMSQGLCNRSIAPLLASGLTDELEDLRRFTSLKNIKIGQAISCSTSDLLSKLQLAFEQHGGRTLNGWVTRINAAPDWCQGVQYQNNDGLGLIDAQYVVIASGGYANLFANSLHAANFGTVLGHYLQCGGLAADMEFIFKHGYGKPDQNSLIPTEDLKGASIVDQNGKHIDWLERELFNGKGTFSHQQVVRFWRSHRHDRYYVNLSYKPLYDKINQFNMIINDNTQNTSTVTEAVNELLSVFPSEIAHTLRPRILDYCTHHRPIDYDLYKTLRPHYIGNGGQKEASQIRQIAYFSMGGIAHTSFRTNLRRVWVTGEAMHDFGANRVGGLPWGLYLVAGTKIADQIEQAAAEEPNRPTETTSIEVCPRLAHFDQRILNIIRKLLFRYQENYFSTEPASRTISRLRRMRRTLIDQGHQLCDAVSWLFVAEAIMASSLARNESRGCFYRDDIPHEDPTYWGLHTCAFYDPDIDAIVVKLVSPEGYTALLNATSNLDPTDAG